MAAEIAIEKLVEGTGTPVKKGNVAVVHYTGWLPNGPKFDSSVGSDPFPFVVGKGEVIGGWDQAVATMRVGDKIRVTIPPALGYGAYGAPPDIPPNATLMFDIELLEVHA